MPSVCTEYIQVRTTLLPVVLGMYLVCTWYVPASEPVVTGFRDGKDTWRLILDGNDARRLMPFFKLFMSAPKDELHQWLVVYSCCTWLSLECESMYLVCTGVYQVHTTMYLYIDTCKTGIRYPTLVTMLNCQSML